MFMLILHITCLVGVATCAKYPNNKRMQTTVEDNRFLIIKFIDRLYLYAEKSFLDKNLVTIILHLDTCVQFTIDCFSAIVDKLVNLLVRQLATLAKCIFYANPWTIDFLVYLLLDMAYHYLIKEVFLCVKWIVTDLLTFVTYFIFYSLHTVVYLSKPIVLSYFFIFTSIFVICVMPLFQFVYWIISFLLTIYFTFWVASKWIKIWTGVPAESDKTICFICMNLLFAIPHASFVYSLWVTFCISIFNYICFPLMIMLYSCMVGLFTFLISEQIYKKYQQFANAFDKDKIINSLVQTLYRVLGVYIYDGSSQTDRVEEQTDLKSVVCYEDTLLVKLFPCQHKIMRYNCTGRILENDSRCPVCRESIGVYIDDGSSQLDRVEEQTDLKCEVCYEDTILVELFPCQHKLMCYNCTRRILENDSRCPVCRESIGVYIDDESSQLDRVEEQTDLKCVVCYEDTLLVKLFPCQHKIMCYNCTRRILENDSRCPVCRKSIISF